MKFLKSILAITSAFMMLHAVIAKEGNNASLPLSQQALTLEQAREIALKNHPEIMSSQYRVESAQHAEKEVIAAYFPQVTANGVRAFSNNNARVSASTEGITNSVIFDRLSGGISTSQLVTDFGRTGYLVGSSRDRVEAETARSFSARDRVLFEVTRAYYNVLRAQKILQVALKTQKARHLLYDQIRALNESELKSNLDVNMAKQTLEEANLLVLNATNNLDKSRAELAQALGFERERIYVLVDNQKTKPIYKTLENLLKKAKEKNPQLIALRAELAAALNQYSAEKAANTYPSVNAFGYVGSNPIRNQQKLQAGYAAAGINVSMPVYTGGKLTAAEQRARSQADAIKKDLANKENQLARDVRLAWNNAQTAYKNIEVSGEFLKITNESLTLTQERYEIGLNSIIDLAQAQLNQTQAEISYANAGYEYLIHKAFLEFLLSRAAEV